MQEKVQEKKRNTLKNIIYIAIIIIAISTLLVVYKNYNFNEFKKGVREFDITNFSRDSNVKYSSTNSYKIENTDYNDAMFSQEIEVTPNTAYRVTCMVKTENVENQKGLLTGGAQIAIMGTTECSKSVTGDSEWTKLTLMFNSKNRENVTIGFRLGGYEEYSKGTAYFSDFKVEKGIIDVDNEWNVVCFIFNNINVNATLNGSRKNIKLNMSDQDVLDMRANIDRFATSMEELSEGKIEVKYRVIEIQEPITTISYDEENEYYVSPQDVQPLIEKYIDRAEYDHIFATVRLGNINNDKEVLVHDWIGLGGMDYYGIGFSNIRLPDSSDNYIYKYDSRINTFPEEVFVHEFLHTLERNDKEYGNTIIELHDYEKYGYETKPLIGLKEWYKDYLNKSVENEAGQKLGLDDIVFSTKPIQESNFEYAYELDIMREPKNIFEASNSLLKRIIKLFNKNE